MSSKSTLLFLSVGLLVVNSNAFSTLHVFKSFASLRSATVRSCTRKPLGFVKMALSPNTVDESTPVEHRGVPAEHQGLHTALYGDGDDHGVSDQTSNEIFMSDVSMPVSKFLELSKGKKAAGVFSITGRDGNVKFISFTRSLYTSLSGKNIEGFWSNLNYVSKASGLRLMRFWAVFSTFTVARHC
jgi:hypothetical protein